MPHPAVIPNSAVKEQIADLEAQQARGISGHGSTATRVRQRLSILYAERERRVKAATWHDGQDV